MSDMFTGVNRELAERRIKSAVAVALLHILIGYAFVAGFGVEIVHQAGERLRLFDVVEPPPPEPEPPAPAKARSKAEEGAAAPENLRARPTEIVAPLPAVQTQVPAPVVVAPVPGRGSDADAGASDRPGPGTGAGGIGTGTGSGRAGSGTGAGAATRARLIGGRIVHSDYPRSAYRARIGGTVVARLSIGSDGRVTHCAITRSSGHVDLDSTTCRLIRERFRYAPALDAQGRPVATVTGWQQRWWLDRDEAAAPAADESAEAAA